MKATCAAAGNECTRGGAPAGCEEAERMARCKADTGKESPFFRPEPVIVTHEICIRKQRVERQEGHGVYVRPPRERGVQ